MHRATRARAGAAAGGGPSGERERRRARGRRPPRRGARRSRKRGARRRRLGASAGLDPRGGRAEVALMRFFRRGAPKPEPPAPASKPTLAERIEGWRRARPFVPSYDELEAEREKERKARQEWFEDEFARRLAHGGLYWPGDPGPMGMEIRPPRWWPKWLPW